MDQQNRRKLNSYRIDEETPPARRQIQDPELLDFFQAPAPKRPQAPPRAPRPYPHEYRPQPEEHSYIQDDRVYYTDDLYSSFEEETFSALDPQEHRDRMRRSRSNRANGGYEDIGQDRPSFLSGKAALAILITVLVLAALVFCVIKFIRVDHVYVEGNSVIPDEEILALAQVKEGQHIFTVNEKDISLSLSADPYLSLEKIDFSFPDTITIIVDERKPVVLIPCADGYVLSDAKGMALDLCKDPAFFSEYAVVSGLHADEYKLGYELRTDDSYKHLLLKDLIAELEKAELLGSIREFHLEDANDLILVNDTGMEFWLGQGDRFDEKLLWIRAVLPDLLKEGITDGVIDVAAHDSATYRPLKSPLDENTGDDNTDDPDGATSTPDGNSGPSPQYGLFYPSPETEGQGGTLPSSSPDDILIDPLEE